jgi:hypothetical protein
LSNQSSSKKRIDDFNRRITALEHRSKVVRGEAESQLQKEERFERLRREREGIRLTRPARHKWWNDWGDGNNGEDKGKTVFDNWNRECLYFPRDNPTQEEQEFYREMLAQTEEAEKKRSKHQSDVTRGRGKEVFFHLESTHEAFWDWHFDELMRESDKKLFPHHNHSDHDFYHDQLKDQDYYYNRTIYGPRGWSDNFLWNLPKYQELQKARDKTEMEKRTNKRKVK